MDSDIPNEPASIRTQMLQVIKDFSQYLTVQKKKGNTFLNLSENSEALIQNWGIKKQAVDFFFEGPHDAAIFIIDSEACFFKGKSGELLVKILKAMNLPAESVFICNADDLVSVHAKIRTISPKMIITLGTKASQSLLNIKVPLEQFRGQFYEFDNIKVMPTFHPSRLLKNSEYKREVWEDMKRVMENLGLNDAC